jgi:hypothetical protein
MIDEFTQAMTSHASDAGRVHIGTRGACVSIDCLPPLLGVREGDVVRVVIPDADVDGDFIVTTESTRDAYTVTLMLTPRHRVP